MIIAVFRGRIRKGAEQQYYRRADEMAAIATRMPGFVSYKAYTAPDGERVSIHEWENADALAAWREHPEHVRMQQYGREHFYDEYTLYVCDAPRTSRFTAPGSRLAQAHGMRIDTVDDALDVMSSGVRCCIFTPDDVAAEFFDLRTNLAGEVLQKFVNYNCQVAFVVPDDHGFGDRVTELIREHRKHPVVRFFPTVEDALQWKVSDV